MESKQDGEGAEEARPEPTEATHRPRWRKILKGLLFIGLGLILLLGLAAVMEARTSWLQSRWFSRLAEEATYQVSEGANPEAWYPGPGPYDLRLGYARLGRMVEEAQAGGFLVESQARVSEGFQSLLDRGAFAIYPEKDQAGLRLLDRAGKPFLQTLFPREVYASFADVPPLVRDALLYIENRELLEPGNPRQNPAVEWDRLARSVGDLSLRKLGSERNVPGASTLATQIEKYRHSPEGRTSSTSEKLKQMASASLRAYLKGTNTLERRQDILTQYLNSVPLSAVRGYGEVLGISDGLRAWYGTDFEEANHLLGASPDSLSVEERSRRAVIYRQVLSLMLAQRRPSYYLATGSGQDDLDALSSQFLRRMSADGVIPAELAESALAVHAPPLAETPSLPQPPFVERKAQNQIRSSLLPLLGVPQLYDLDRLDLTVETTMDMKGQEVATEYLLNLTKPEFVSASGLNAFRLLERGDPSRVIYSLTLSERTPGANRVRVQTDNFNGPFNINEGSRIELGSTAKLRTLVTYLELMEEIYEDLAQLTPDSLSRLSVPPQDAMGRWGATFLTDHPGASKSEMLEAAMERRYSANPGERFRTGGGTQTFVNFNATDNGLFLTVAEGLQNSVNLVWVRVMRDVIAHIMYGSPESKARMLEDAQDPFRQEYLARFAQQEGGLFVDRFYRKYAAVEPDSILAELVEGRQLSPQRMAWAVRTVNPLASLEAFTTFVETHALNARLTAGSAPDLYARTSPEGQSLADLGYLASVHPLELWVAGYLLEHPGAGRTEVLEASMPHRQAVYAWLFRTSRRNAQDVRIRSLLEMEAFTDVLRMWKRVGYPFDNLVPSLGTAIGSSGDRPAALAELVGILVNGGVRLPTVRIEGLHFAQGTPYEVNLSGRPAEGERVLSPELAEVARNALRKVVSVGTGRRINGALRTSAGEDIPIGGKTGTGDNRFRVFAPGGVMVESRPVNRTSTFVFFLGDRYFGVITAYVPGPEAGDFGFTSSLPLEILRRLLPDLALYDPS